MHFRVGHPTFAQEYHLLFKTLLTVYLRQFRHSPNRILTLVSGINLVCDP